MPRIPLPVKLLLSYLCILLFGAGPTIFYIRAELQDDLMADAARQLGDHGKLMARQLTVLSPSERLERVQKLGEISPERLTYISPQGDILIDTEVPSLSSLLDNHASRPEVRQALGDTLLPTETFARGPRARMGLGVGVARRLSATLKIDTLYVAVRVTAMDGSTVGILRLATPVDRIEAMTNGTVRFLRNATAVAVSLAIGFSLLAAVLFVRPLRRVIAMAMALTSGDLGSKVERAGNDEVGDVARALNQMATALRRRLLDAGLGEALLSQLVEALPCPCVVFSEGGEVIALNGAGRRTLGIEGPLAGQRMKEFAERPLVLAALANAEHEGEPEPVVVPLMLPSEPTKSNPSGSGGSVASEDEVLVRGVVHVLKRPGTAPLRVFIGESPRKVESTLLPPVDQVVARSLAEVIEEAERRSARVLSRAGMQLELLRPVHQLKVADAEDRLVRVLTEAIEASAVILGGETTTLVIGLSEEPTRVRVQLPLELAPGAVATIRPLLEPLGGGIEVGTMETSLWLPRA